MSLKNQNLDVQGHRGCRGLYPENTLPSFQHAIEIGVNTLELDVVITKDRKVVVSHDPFFSHIICVDEKNNYILQKEEKIKHKIFDMQYEQVKKYKCGTLKHPCFPNQIQTLTYKPLLSEVIELAESLSKSICYNIETKCTLFTDNVFHPKPKEFANLLIEIINHYQINSKVIIQSFDIRTLQHLKNEEGIRTSLLVDNTFTPEKNISHLGFKPDIYSPNYLLVTKELKDFCDNHNINILPWTVNKEEDMIKLINLGVDGIITDYPDRLLNIIQ